MAGTGRIIGDIVGPIGDESDWSAKLRHPSLICAGELFPSAVFLQVVECDEHLCAMLIRFYIQPHFLHHSIGINEKSVSCGKLSNTHIHDGIVGGRNLAVGVGQEFEGEPFFSAKLLV